jgi:Rps23 Pro-64 3,4-dihydroxylase Tpa1-like proline 4-hydroxylase
MLSSARHVQLDHWLALEDHSRLLNYVFQQESNFVPSDTLVAADKKGEEIEHRKSLLLFSFPEFSHLVETRILEVFPDLLVQLGLPSLQISRFETQLTAHKDGNFFKAHTDNAIYDRGAYKDDAVRSRLLTYVYYFYKEPKAFSGGDLRLYDSKVVDNCYTHADSFQTIEPRNNSIVFFLSRYFHEVLPVSCPSRAFTDSRFTINGWIRCRKSVN